MYTYHNYNKYFFLTDTINDDIERKALKFVNLNIIYYNEKETEKKEIDIIKYNKIYNFCKKNHLLIIIHFMIFFDDFYSLIFEYERYRSVFSLFPYEEDQLLLNEPFRIFLSLRDVHDMYFFSF